MGKLLERLKDPTRSGVYRVAGTVEVLDATKDSKLLLARISHAEKSQLMENIAKALEFPDWFGHNWDALEDCLTDLSWRDAPGYVLLFDHARRGDELGVLIDILRSSAEWWAGRGKPFFAVFVDPGHALELPALFRPA
jgi:RNAse (barnase) inhibitor barstar